MLCNSIGIDQLKQSEHASKDSDIYRKTSENNENYDLEIDFDLPVFADDKMTDFILLSWSTTDITIITTTASTTTIQNKYILHWKK
jgi:hypothetical protein